MPVLRLRIDKYAPFAEGMAAAFARVTPLAAKRLAARSVTVGVGRQTPFTEVVLPAARWLVDARLPSGERVVGHADLRRGDDELTLTVTPSSRESRSWVSTFSRTGHLVDARRTKAWNDGGASVDLPYEKELGRHDLSVVTQADPTADPLPYAGPFSTGQNGPDLQFHGDRGLIGMPGNRPTGRAFIVFDAAREVGAVPFPWSGDSETWIQAQALPDLRGPGRLRLKVWVIDPQLSPAAAFLEVGDTEAALLHRDAVATACGTALQQKRRNPMAAAAGALLLIRLRAYRDLHDWPLNLSDWFPELPDAHAIAAWCVLFLKMNRRGRRRPSRTARAALAGRLVDQAVRAGVPYFTDSVRLLSDTCAALTGASDAVLPVRAAGHVRRWAAAVRPDSFVAVYQYGEGDAALNRFLVTRPLELGASHA